MKNRTIPLVAVLAVVLARYPVVGDETKNGIDAEGYVCTWLVLAPIPLKEGQSGADALDEESVKDEANLKPEAGDKLDVGGKDLAWKVCATNLVVKVINEEEDWEMSARLLGKDGKPATTLKAATKRG
jgi:hypothetical protein